MSDLIMRPLLRLLLDTSGLSIEDGNTQSCNDHNKSKLGFTIITTSAGPSFLEQYGMGGNVKKYYFCDADRSGICLGKAKFHLMQIEAIMYIPPLKT